MAIYGNKNVEEMRRISKITYRNKAKENHEKVGNYNLKK